MPNMNGFDAAERIRDIEVSGKILLMYSRVPIIGMTAQAAFHALKLTRTTHRGPDRHPRMTRICLT